MRFRMKGTLLAAALAASGSMAAFAEPGAAPASSSADAPASQQSGASGPAAKSTVEANGTLPAAPGQDTALPISPALPANGPGAAFGRSGRKAPIASDLARINRAVTLVFANAETSDWLKTLSTSAGIPLSLDPALKLNSLAPLSVVASHAPFYPLLLQIATTEGLGIQPIGDGFRLYQLSPAVRAQMNGYGDYVNNYGRPLGYSILPAPRVNAEPSQNMGLPAPTESSPIGGRASNGSRGGGQSYSEPRGVGGGAGGQFNSADNSAHQIGRPTQNADMPFYNGQDFSGSSAMAGAAAPPPRPAAVPGSPAANSPALAKPPIAVVQSVQAAGAQASATMTPDLNPAYLSAGGYGGYNGGAYAAGAPSNIMDGTSINGPALQILSYVLTYANAAGQSFGFPDQVYPQLKTTSGSLQYVAIVLEAFNQLPQGGKSGTSPIAITRLRALLSRAEAIHQRASHRQELQTEIWMLQRRLPTAASPSIQALLNSILHRRESELAALEN